MGQYMRSGQADEDIQRDIANKAEERRKEREIAQAVDR